jgi:putative SOS response-associated peptidase YedK
MSYHLSLGTSEVRKSDIQLFGFAGLYDTWLDPDMTEPEEIVSLLRPYPAEMLQAMPAIA